MLTDVQTPLLGTPLVPLKETGGPDRDAGDGLRVGDALNPLNPLNPSNPLNPKPLNP